MSLLPSEKARLARLSLGGLRRIEMPGKVAGSEVAFGSDAERGNFFQYFSGDSRIVASIDEDKLSTVELIPLLREYGKASSVLDRDIEAITLGMSPSEYGPRSFKAYRSNSYVSDVVLDAYREEQVADLEEAMMDKSSRTNSYVTDVVLESVESGEEAMMDKTSPGVKVQRAARQRITWASELEAEKEEAKAEASEQQAEADQAKAEADRIRGASTVDLLPIERYAAQASGLYGYTKGTQRDVEASVRKAQNRASKLARHLFSKDERTAPFLQVHAKRSGSKTARLLVAAMKGLGPKLSSERVAAHVEIGKAEMDALHKDGKAEVGEHTVSFKEASEKVAGGLYGHPTKTARLVLSACSDLRAFVGEVAYSLHSRRTSKYAKVTGFLKEHGKTTKCGYSRMLLSCYPDAPVAKQAAFPGATVSAIQSGVSQLRSQAGIEAMSDEDADDDPAEKMARKAFVPDSVDGWLEWADGTRTAAHKEA